MKEAKRQSALNYEVLIMMIVGIVPLIIWPMTKTTDYFYLPKVIALYVIITIFYLKLIISRKALRSFVTLDSVTWLLLFYLLALSISVSFALNTELALYGKPLREEGLFTILLYISTFLIARHVAPTAKLYRYFITTGIFLACYGISQYFGFDPVPRDWLRTDWTSSFSTFGNPNFFGSYLVLMLPISMFFMFRRPHIVASIGYTIIFFALLTSRTRGAWIGAFVAFVYYLVILFLLKQWSKQTTKALIYLTLCSLLALGAFQILSPNVFGLELGSIITDAKTVVTTDKNFLHAGSNRMYIWLKTLALVTEQPFTGYGLENLQIAFVSQYKDDMLAQFGRVMFVDKAHNEYLHIAVTAGIPALVIYLSFLVQIARKYSARLAESDVYQALTASLIGYLTQAFFNISVVSVAFIFWAFLGLMAHVNARKVH
ncbi:MAG: O-antigen ligase family protein [Bacillota bacterium]